jgi:peroxiredoxin
LTSWKGDYERIQAAGAEVLAVSVDHIYALNVFHASLGMLPYPLLSDWHKLTAKAYGVLDVNMGVAKRSVFVIDRDGVIRYRNLEFKAQEPGHYEETLKQLELLR